MAEDMIERAAKALYVCESVRAGHTARVVSEISGAPSSFTIEPFEECADTAWRPDARAALLAALDPEDEALVERIARDMLGPEYPWEGLSDDPIGFDEFRNETRDKYRTFARAAIATLKAMAQGVSVSQEQVREKD